MDDSDREEAVNHQSSTRLYHALHSLLTRDRSRISPLPVSLKLRKWHYHQGAPALKGNS